MPPINITRLIGRNGVDSPVDSSFPFDMAVEMVNVDLTLGGLGAKREGSNEVLGTWTGGTAFTTGIHSILRHNPTPATQELWAVDVAATPLMKRHVTGTTTWADVAVTVETVSTGSEHLVQGTSFNDKFFLSFPSSASRMHVYGLNTSGTNSLRRVGIAPGSNAPTVADTGAGAYAAVLRYYRVRWALVDGSSVIHKMSEPTPSVSFTPSGAGTAARVTKPTTPANEDVNTWYVEASTDNVNFFQISSGIAIGTTTYDDSAATTTYASSRLSDPQGYFSLPPSYTATITDNNRLIGIFGSRIYWGPILGVLNRGDDERIVETATQKPYLDLNPKDGGDLTAIARTVNGVIYVFKLSQVWRVTPTGNALQPYSARKISDTVGSVSKHAVCSGEDAAGNPVVYFWSERGPYYAGADGITYLGRDIEDLTRNTAFGYRMNTNVGATVVAHVQYLASRSMLFCWWSSFSALGAGASFPANLAVNFTKLGTRRDQYGLRGGWVKFDGKPANARCSCVFRTASTFTDDAIWIGENVSNAPKVYELLNGKDALYRDDSTDYAYEFRTRHPIPPDFSGLLNFFKSSLICTGNAHGLTQTITAYHPQSAAESRTSTATVTSGRSMTQFEGSAAADCIYATIDVAETTQANAELRVLAFEIGAERGAAS